MVAASRAECDLSSADAIRKLVAEVRPSVIVNPAAYTAVNEAEAHSDLAYAINRAAAEILAEEARRSGAMFVHYSTDYVFDGRKPGAYTESDEPAPLNVYGASKLAGERAVAAAGGRFLVLRTSWVYGANGNNFLLTIRRSGAGARRAEDRGRPGGRTYQHDTDCAGYGKAGAAVRDGCGRGLSGRRVSHDRGRQRLLVRICASHCGGAGRKREVQIAADSGHQFQRISDAGAASAEFGSMQRQI